MNFKKAFFLYFAAMLLLPLISGCAAFRRTFSRTPESMKRSPASPRKKTPPRRQGETGDKLFDTVFGRGKKDNRQKFHSTEITPAEQRLLESGFDALPRTAKDDPDARRILERDRKSRDARSRDVYLPGVNF